MARPMYPQVAASLARVCERTGETFDPGLSQTEGQRLLRRLRKDEPGAPLAAPRYTRSAYELRRLCELTGHTYDPAVSIGEARRLIGELAAARKAEYAKLDRLRGAGSEG